jgi:polar amino acid transport system substrate-binding protein
MDNTSKRILAGVGVAVLAVGAGFLGASIKGGGAAAATNTDASQGAFLKGIKDRGELRVGVAIAPPMTVQEEDGTLGGPNLIPLQELAKQLGVKLVAVPAEWKNIVAGLQANRYDFAANLDHTVERSLSIQFTDPVYAYQGVFVVKADAPYNTSESLIKSGKPITTAQGSAPEKAVQAAGAKILSVDNFSNALSSVQSGRAIAEFADLPTAESQAQADPSLKIIVPDPAIYSATAAYGVPDNTDARSLQTINIAIERARDSGDLTRAYEKVKYVEIDNLGDLVKK